MTIKEYFSSFPEKQKQHGLIETLSDCTEIWNNNACLGYAKLAATMIGLNDEQSNQLIASMIQSFNTVTISEAAKYFSET